LGIHQAPDQREAHCANGWLPAGRAPKLFNASESFFDTGWSPETQRLSRLSQVPDAADSLRIPVFSASRFNVAGSVEFCVTDESSARLAILTMITAR
jgi:hypothetical protein